MDVITKLIKYYNEYLNNKKQSELAKWLLLNIHDTVPDTIYELAEKCYTSPTAISRFMKTIEYTGFSQYKYFVRDTLNTYCRRNCVLPANTNLSGSTPIVDDYVNQMSSALKGFSENTDQEKINEICKKIDASKNIICISPEIGNFPIFQYDLFLCGKTSKFPYGLSETEEYLKDVDSSSFALVYIPQERESTRMIHSLDLMQSKGIPMAILADEGYTAINRYSDLIIRYKATNTNLDNVLYNAFMDVIILTYRRTYIDNT